MTTPLASPEAFLYTSAFRGIEGEQVAFLAIALGEVPS
jgi:hypothetical protein